MSFHIHHGDALAVLRTMPDESVNCIVTSPPYWGLRDYGVEGQMGLEPTPDAFVAAMVGVFREARRVLRSDGTLWLNIGDSYATGAGKVGSCPGGGEQGEKWAGYRGTRGESPKHANGAIGPMTQPNRMPIPGLKPKDLCMVPARLALALQADGWWLRSDIIWSKPNPMPESITDRPTKAHEYIFLLTKSERYFYDADAIREESVSTHPSGNGFKRESRLSFQNADGSPRGNDKQWKPHKLEPLQGSHGTTGHDGNGMRMPEKWNNPAGRNARTVWTIATQPTPEAHFATFPVALAERCILAGCRPDGIVLDPFSGAGTTGLAALKHGRRFVGIELNAEYIAIAHKRLNERMPLLAISGEATA